MAAVREASASSADPYGHWKTTTFVAGPRCDGLTAPFVNDGPINGEWFRAYVEKVLAPTQRPGDIVILDNLGAHKVAGCARPSRARRRLLYLPPYSPDLNPIEQLFAKLSCARPPPELSRPFGQPSPPCSPPSATMNAQITSPTQVIDAHRKALWCTVSFAFQRGGPLALWRDREEAYRVPAAPLTSSLQDPRVLAFLLVWVGSTCCSGSARSAWLGSSRRLHGRRISAGSLPVSWHSSHSIPFDLDGRRPE